MGKYWRLCGFLAICGASSLTNCYALGERNFILMVWDGLRPDSITAKTTPNLFRLAREGSYFSDNHSSFPTFTMMNAAAFATGDFAAKSGFYGNTLWDRKASGYNADARAVDFQQPVFTEDYQILSDLNREEPLTEVYSLFGLARRKGIVTATLGKSGPAFFQDYHQQGIVFDEKHVYPEEFALYLKSLNYPLPIDTVHSYPQFRLNPNNGDPTASSKLITLADGVTSDPTEGLLSPYDTSNGYLMDSYLTQIVPRYKPRLSVIWLRNPDTTEHAYGVGSKAYLDALANQDHLLGKLMAQLKLSKQWQNTDLIIASDHGHSNVSGELSLFPLRTIAHGEVGSISNVDGYAVSGDFRAADLLSRAGFKAYDGLGCQYDPVLSGITASGQQVYPTKRDSDGRICGKPTQAASQNSPGEESLGVRYTTPAYLVPQRLPQDAVIVAANGGSTYFYVPDHNRHLIEKLVRFCQSRQEFGAIFSDARYGDIPGTFRLASVNLQNKQNRNPDLIVSSNFDDKERILGFPGIEYNSSGTFRGMHGSFSPIDVHNVLLAYGPDFKRNFIDSLPSGNVDVAPTLAYLLGIGMPNTDGRVLLEALTNGPSLASYRLRIDSYSPKAPASKLRMHLATSADGKDIDAEASNYTILLQSKSLQQDGREYSYFDWARALRY